MKTMNIFRCSTLWLGFLLVLLLIGSGKASTSQPIATTWQALQRGEAVALIRHAIAPGTGDPPGFLLRDCSTQRNLSKEGRIQARRIGDFFRAQGIKEALVYSSQWCRCLETARLLGFGPVQELPALNSFFEEPARRTGANEKNPCFSLDLCSAGSGNIGDPSGQYHGPDRRLSLLGRNHHFSGRKERSW